jgi:hypothetical protein
MSKSKAGDRRVEILTGRSEAWTGEEARGRHALVMYKAPPGPTLRTKHVSGRAADPCRRVGVAWEGTVNAR